MKISKNVSGLFLEVNWITTFINTEVVWIGMEKEYTGRTIEKKVTYVLKTKDLKFWQKEDVEKYGYQILSLE